MECWSGEDTDTLFHLAQSYTVTQQQVVFVLEYTMLVMNC